MTNDPQRTNDPKRPGFANDVRREVERVMPELLRGQAFRDRKLTDTPSDALQVVPRGYVTANGSVAGRPSSPVTGQFYISTDTGIPMWYTPAGWRNGVGSIVAS